MTLTDLGPAANATMFIGIIGPPASGKSTLAASLSTALDAPIIRPRDAIRAAVNHEPQLHELFVPINELGWVSDGALGLAVRAAVARVPATCRAVVLENLPGDNFQVADIHMAVRQRGGRFVVLHLESANEVLIARGTGRRVCQTCEADSTADPHDPAQPSTIDPRLCGRCGNPLTVRPDDEDGVLRERTVRHRHYARGVLRMVTALDIPLIGIDAAATPSAVHAAAFDAVTLLATPAHHDG
ncbi:hypothetical protein [Catellatospora tritici]|uniref:hypothetical protein n=1 Tax=Catellatospora tritici TaxID=2851566 RepID=UPI001C2D6943|nr:hypothetical protein [Catellatospora tritici]MBV1854551.1 hypothetical protein [Catellatospora tritici]